MMDRLRRYWPSLSVHARITSPENATYNCISWALAETHRKWSPGLWTGGYFWPRELGTADTIETWVAVFRMHAYDVCATADLEPGYEKVAIYFTPRDGPLHVARQLESGWWTSKLGNWEDIEHPGLEDLVGREYGQVGPILKRPSRT